MIVEQEFEASSSRATEVVVRAPASRRELMATLIIGIIAFSVASVFTVYVTTVDVPDYWLGVAVSLLTFAGVSLCLFVRSYFKSVEFSATAEGLIIELEVISGIRKIGDSVDEEGYVDSVEALVSIARKYGDGSLASGNRDTGYRLIEISTLVGQGLHGRRMPSDELVAVQLENEAGDGEPV